MLNRGIMTSINSNGQVVLNDGAAIDDKAKDIELENGYVKAQCKNGKLQGANIEFRSPSVGATENIMMGAVLAEASHRSQGLYRS